MLSDVSCDPHLWAQLISAQEEMVTINQDGVDDYGKSLISNCALNISAGLLECVAVTRIIVLSVRSLDGSHHKRCLRA